MLNKYLPYLMIGVAVVGFLVYQQRQSMPEVQQSSSQIEQQQPLSAMPIIQEEGLITTASGLQYKILEQGDNQNFPTETDKVKVHYRGTLLDGTEFDSSYSRNQPISFGLSQVIPGWTEGLQLMSIGSKARLVIPAELGYGDQDIGSIPANSTLVFDVELLDIE